MKKRHLEILLDELKPHPNPKAHLEQYSTEGNLASELLLFAEPDIKNSFLIDFGCGTGRFSIGAKLLGAKFAVGIDIDFETVETAKKNAESLNTSVDFFKLDIKDVNSNFFEERYEYFKNSKKVIIQNPPFGAQKKYADRIFLDKALEVGDVVYTIHNTATRDFLTNYIQRKNRKITNIFQANFRIPAIYEFHKKNALNIPVDIYRIE
ncbi:methyltransferase small [Methanococcus vannielii SB]|uniref:Methyltransferase small n=1 Tax=Methanococcus vannielii (strain ATCC 35089 / DSM 1224 / JCM 13029 / OCM 148 / SB) TaxID=406327 RepID=A6USC9_METVS|nr:METTL5 family protein [Methanococcus vannielii]ABR55401.1 methyltransferase small [Methanococcus vannielii SB]